MARRGAVRCQAVKADEGPNSSVEDVVGATVCDGHWSDSVASGFKHLVIGGQGAIGNFCPGFIMEAENSPRGRVLPSVCVLEQPVLEGILHKEMVAYNITEGAPDARRRLDRHDVVESGGGDVKGIRADRGWFGTSKRLRQHTCCCTDKLRDELSTLGDSGCGHGSGHLAEMQWARALVDTRAGGCTGRQQAQSPQHQERC